MLIPEEAWNAAWQGNWEDDEGTSYRILEKPPVDAPTQLSVALGGVGHS